MDPTFTPWTVDGDRNIGEKGKVGKSRLVPKTFAHPGRIRGAVRLTEMEASLNKIQREMRWIFNVFMMYAKANMEDPRWAQGHETRWAYWKGWMVTSFRWVVVFKKGTER